ncbi:MAG: hypothetical protein ACLQVY_17990, partial [Limisphaerales bacterium]
FESSLKRGKKQQTTITINDSRPEESILNYALRGLKNGVRLKRDLKAIFGTALRPTINHFFSHDSLDSE